ncbi:MAG: DEAD/DEAH box helicase, partial [Cyanobium sp.]
MTKIIQGDALAGVTTSAVDQAAANQAVTAQAVDQVQVGSPQPEGPVPADVITQILSPETVPVPPLQERPEAPVAVHFEAAVDLGSTPATQSVAAAASLAVDSTRPAEGASPDGFDPDFSSPDSAGPGNGVSPAAGFARFGLADDLLRGLADLGFQTPSPIQLAAIPELLLGRDLVGQAQTGTGKTAAFSLPLLHRLDPEQRTPQVLVLTPTRELAIQVADAINSYAAQLSRVRVAAIYGGSDFRDQILQLRRGVQIVVGTPGRVMDHMRQGTLDLSGLRTLVLDEADEMLRMGFIDDVEWVLEQLPAERQVVLFSATMPREIRQLSHRYLREPAEVTIRTNNADGKRIRQRHLVVHPSQKLEALERVLEAERSEGVIIFARTKAVTLTVAESLEAHGYEVAVLNGDVPQAQRERTI